MYWNLIVIALCSLLLLFVIWKEIKRPYKSWLVARLVASVFAVTALAFLTLPFTIKRQQKKFNPKVIILLTDNFNRDSVKSLIRFNTEAKIFTMDKGIKAFNVKYITDLTSLTEPSGNIKAIHIFGYGLDESDLSLLNVPVVFHPALIKNSITAVSWTQTLSPGEPLIVQGSFNNTTSSPAKIILTGFNINVDSVTVAPAQASYFQLTTTPKYLDKAVYSLVAVYGGKIIEKEPIPVEIKSTQPLSILLLAASPDFENKFLKNWLAKNGYKLAVRTSISNNKYDKEYVNIASVSLDRITPSLLEKFDIIIADAAELNFLPASDIGAIRTYVENKGTGLIVKTDSAGNVAAFYLQSFPLSGIRDSVQHLIKLNLYDTEALASPLKIEQPVYIRDVAGTQPLFRDQQMHIMVNSKMYGSGKIIVTTIPDTYGWKLSGNNNDYDSYWSWILQKAAKETSLNEAWIVSPALPRKNETVKLKIQTLKANIPQVQAGQDIAYPEQDQNLLYQWNASYWPAKTGWQPLIGYEGLTTWWYVYNNKDWKGINALTKINATKKYAAAHIYKPLQASISNAETGVDFPKIYFFIIFITCSGFLWMEKKFREQRY